MIRHRLTTALASAALAISASLCAAAEPSPPPGYPTPPPTSAATNPDASNRPAPGGYPQATTSFPYFDLNAAAMVAGQAAGARAQMARAEQNIAGRIMGLRLGFENSNEYRAAQRDIDQAREDVDVQRRSVLNYLAGNGEYKSALVQREALSNVLAAGGLSPGERTLTAERKLAYATLASKLEVEALSQETKYVAAQTRLGDAHRKMRELSFQFDERVRGDAEVRVAREMHADAKVAAAAAQGYLNALSNAYSAVVTDYGNLTRPRYYTQPYYGYGYGYGTYGYGSSVVIRQ